MEITKGRLSRLAIQESKDFNDTYLMTFDPTFLSFKKNVVLPQWFFTLVMHSTYVFPSRSFGSHILRS